MKIRVHESTGYENSPWREWLQQSYFAHECIRMVLAGETEWLPLKPDGIARMVDEAGEHVTLLLRERLPASEI